MERDPGRAPVMSTDLVVDEGASIALAPLEIEHVRRLLGGLVDVRDGAVTFSRVVGHLRLPTKRVIRIRSSKAPAASILAWAAYVDPRLDALRTLSGKVPALGAEGDLASLLARLFVAELEDAILRHGLLRQYRRGRTDTQTVRGRIDFARLARQGANLARVPCEIWDRAEGTPLNRFLAAALAACARDPVLRAASDPGLSRARARMASIEPGIDAALLRGLRPLDRAEQPFAPVIALARMLLEGIGLIEGAEQTATGFLVNLELLFERTVVRALRESGVDVTPQAPLPYVRWTNGRAAGGSSFAIDALCRGLDGGDLIVDAKYKRQISSANLHQMIAYCALTGASRAALVVPAGVVADRRAYVFDRVGSSPVRIDIVEIATNAPDVAGWRANARAMAATLLAH